MLTKVGFMLDEEFDVNVEVKLFAECEVIGEVKLFVVGFKVSEGEETVL